MGTAKMNVWLRNAACDLIPNCWRTDLVIQACTGTYLVDSFPTVINQLQKHYGKPATTKCISTFPLITDQSGKTLSLAVGTNPAQILTFTAPSMSLTELFTQMEAFFTNCEVTIENGMIAITTDEHGPQATLTIGGDCDLTWGQIVQGSGWTIKKHFYQNAWRIMFFPGNGETVNHIEIDIPPGCYRVWTRICHGNNEETSIQMINARCDDHVCVNLLLPTIKTCAAHIIHPIMNRIVKENFLLDDAERLLPFRALMWGAGIGKQEILAQLDYRIQEAQEKGDPELETDILAVKAVAQLLPECY